MKTIKLFLLICLAISAKTGFSQSTDSIDSILVNFINDFELKVVYDTSYINPPNKDSIWSKVFYGYRILYGLPTFYGEVYKEGLYFFEKICFGDTTEYVILMYSKKDYSLVQCQFSVLNGKHIESASMIFALRSVDSSCGYVYDKTHYLSEFDFFFENMEKRKKKKITSSEFKKQAEFLTKID